MLILSTVVTNLYAAPTNKKACVNTNTSSKSCDPAEGCLTCIKREPRPAPPPATECCALPPSKYAIPMQGTRYNWSFGADVFYMYAEVKPEYSQLFRSEKTGGTIYLQQRFRNPFGWELGFSWTDRKPKNLSVVPGTVVFNTVSNSSATIAGRLRLKNTYIDFQAHVPLCKYIESKFILGVGWVRQSLEFTYMPNTNTNTIQNATRLMEGRTAVTARLGFGAQALITKRWGTRLIFMYETMSHIKIRNVPYDVSQQVMNDSFSIIWGLYFTFQGLRNYHSVEDFADN